jgi:hypothetical protein
MAAKNQPKPADGIAQTVIESEDGLGEPPQSVAFTSPWGTKVTVNADLADQFKDAGYKPAK